MEITQRRNRSKDKISVEYCYKTRSIYVFSDTCIIAGGARKPDNCKM